MSSRARLWMWVCLSLAALAMITGKTGSADIFAAAAFVIRALSREVQGA